MAGQPVGDHAAEQQEGKQRNQTGRGDVPDATGRTSDPQHRERDRYEGDRRPGQRNEVTRPQQTEVAAAQHTLAYLSRAYLSTAHGRLTSPGVSVSFVHNLPSVHYSRNEQGVRKLVA